MIKRVIALIILASLLYACGPTVPIEPTIDVNAIHTFAAETVIAEFTQTAQAIPPTVAATATDAASLTPEATVQPTDTPVPTNNPFEATPTDITCDDAIWVADVTVPDGTQMTPGQDFVKTWKIKNTGSCTWGTGYTLIHGYDEKLDGIAEPLTTAVAPGEEVEVSVRFKAPSNAGEHRSYWRMQNASGSTFGEFFYVSIVVR
jgi:Ig-like domain from next to BRCA1 gene